MADGVLSEEVTKPLNWTPEMKAQHEGRVWAEETRNVVRGQTQLEKGVKVLEAAKDKFPDGSEQLRGVVAAIRAWNAPGRGQNKG